MWIDVLKTGTFTANNGKTVDFTGDDLDSIRDGYDPENRKAPLVFGHPRENGPAFGWAKSLRRVGEKLQARFDQVSDTVKDLVKNGHYKKVSLSLFPDKKTLRHVGLLGAVQPAVPGLEDVSFDGGDEALVFEFATQNKPENHSNNNPATKEEHMDQVEELKENLRKEKEKREAAETSLSIAEEKTTAAEKKAEEAETQLSAGAKAAREKEMGDRIDKLVGKRILPKDKPAVSAIAMSLAEDDLEIELSAGAGKKKTVDHLFDFLDGLPDRGLLDEFAAPSGDDKVEDLTGLTGQV